MTDYGSQIAAGVQAIGLTLDPARIEMLAVHLRLLDEANREFNLTRIPASDSVLLHVIDSLLAVPSLAQCIDGPFCDLGSGAGFPGVPLGVASGRRAALVESSRKKAAFLQSVVARLRLEATVHPVRAEELAVEQPGGYAAVTARALSALPSLVELAAPMLQRGGVLIALKARLEDDECARGRQAARLCGMRECDRIETTLPGADVVRTLVLYEKIGEQNVRLPRRPGMAQRKPLA